MPNNDNIWWEMDADIDRMLFGSYIKVRYPAKSDAERAQMMYAEYPDRDFLKRCPATRSPIAMKLWQAEYDRRFLLRPAGPPTGDPGDLLRAADASHDQA